MKHRACVKNQATDTLSRIVTDGSDKAVRQEDFPVMGINNEEADNFGCVSNVLEDFSSISTLVNILADVNDHQH